MKLRIAFGILALVPVAGVAGCVHDKPLSALQPIYATAPSQFLDLAPGFGVHYRDVGPRNAPVVLLVHGSNASLHSFEGWVPTLSSTFRVISLDLPAHGLTGPDPATKVYNAGYYVGFLEAFREKLGVARWAVAGNSMGGAIGWRYALAHPDRISALVLVDAAGYPRDGGSPFVFKLARAPIAGEMFSAFVQKGMLEGNLKQVFADDSLVTEEKVQLYYDMMLRSGNRKATLARLRSPIDLPDEWRKMNEIKVPTLVQWGDQDPWIPVSDAERFAADIPGAQKIIYPGIGHLPQEEIPEKSAADAAAFLRGALMAPPAVP
jgi:pimeloyl-ACP methyl ester carboxylesterase